MAKSDKDSNRIAIALVVDSSDNILMGIRKDSFKYTVPAGHIHENECPFSGCQRELKEETGLDAKEIELVGVEWSPKKKLMLYLFRVELNDPNQKIDIKQDPDKEFITALYVDPNNIIDELHVPLSENVAIKYWSEN